MDNQSIVTFVCDQMTIITSVPNQATDDATIYLASVKLNEYYDLDIESIANDFSIEPM